MCGALLFKNYTMNLQEYYNLLVEHQRTHTSGRPPIITEGIKTLWVPAYSGNRTATLNLNHQVNSYDPVANMAYGENGNCYMPYVIIEVPIWFSELHVDKVAELLCKEMNKPAGYPTIRVLKIERIEAIKRIISTLQQDTPQ